MKKIHWKKLLLHIAVPFLVGGISSLLTRSSMAKYQTLNQPPFAPPSFLFPIVWTTLFLLMGISTYLLAQQDERKTTPAYRIYALQLLLNFIWPIIFFRLEAYLFAFMELLILIIIIWRMIVIFKRIYPLAGNLQIPYLLWTLFAAYLNFAIYLLN